MADTIFFLDDADEQELGGFNDQLPPVNPEEVPDKDINVELENEELNPKPDQDPAEDVDPETAPEEDPKPDPNKEDPKPGFDPDTAIAMIAKQNEQIAAQSELIQKMSTPKSEPKELEPPTKPTFTPDQWDDDPEGCNEALWDYRDESRAFSEKITAMEAETEAQERNAAAQAAHQASWELSVDVMPELAGNDRARRAWAAVFHNPEAGFVNDPNGPLEATRALKNFMKEKNYSFDGKAPTPDPTPDPDEAKKAGAADEAARQSRVNKQGMHTGGKGGGKQAVQLSAEQKNFCREKNISEESFAATFAAMGGK